MLACLYNIIIMPLVLIMDIIFSIGYRIFESPGIAIIGVSLGVNIFSLPLYRKADAVQSAEREIQKKMTPMVKHIRHVFKGDEQFMILQAYYREMDYSPVMIFRGSLPLLLQIPFFTAAYRYLSSLSILKGSSFLMFSDLGRPDQLIVLAGITINLLPILMTLINFVSGMIYTRGFPLKDKAQLYILALVFLVILYDCPSGLVFYWTLNNLFSLFKNIFMKLIPEPGKVIAVLVGAGSVAAAMLLALTGHLGDLTGIEGFNNLLLVLIIVLFLNIPLFRLIRNGKRIVPEKIIDHYKKNENMLGSRGLSLLSGGFITLFIGAIVPLGVISVNPLDYIDNDGFVNPVRYVGYDILIAGGLFLFWGCLVYFSLMETRERAAYNSIMCVLSAVSVVDFMIFNKNFGNITINLRFDDHVRFSRKDTVVNLAAVIIAAIAVYIFFMLKPKLMKQIFMVLFSVELIFTGIKVCGINNIINTSHFVEEARALAEKDEPIFHLSHKGKNVVVFMLDRAISGYFPYIMNEKPDLAEKFSGFTYYPNTISFGTHTNFGSSPIFGGYEYTPDEMNKRTEELLRDKHDESLLVLPALFSGAGYEVTVADPPDAHYSDPPDLRIYDGYENVHAYNTVLGQYYHLLSDEEKLLGSEELMYRKYFLYSILRISPFLLQRHIYDEGNYLAVNKTEVTKRFLNRYAVIKNLSYLTDFDENENGNLMLIDNTTTHEPVILQMPEYVPQKNVDNDVYDDESRFTLDGKTVYANDDPTPYHYHVNMASLLKLGEWFDYLRDNGVYDNTRIIIVSDHGRGLGQFKDMIMDDGKLDVQYVNPLFLVKDFDSKGELRTDDTFMTNADTPSIAMQGIIDDPINPFTGKKIDTSEKTKHPQLITMSQITSTADNNGNVFLTYDADWYSVQDDIFDENNWVNLGTYEQAKSKVDTGN